MSIKYYIYRRISKFATCEIALNSYSLPLESKYHVASFADVFCNPFYWQIYTMLDSPPEKIVDCGGHMGHFSILVDQCIRAKFQKCDASYIIVEPNERIHKALMRNLERAGLDQCSQLVSGLLGAEDGGEATLWVNHSNFLSASTQPSRKTTPQKSKWVSLRSLVPEGVIDILKIDIEGAEYEFIPTITDILERTKILMMELHGSDGDAIDGVKSLLKNSGLIQYGGVQSSAGNLLIAYKRS